MVRRAVWWFYAALLVFATYVPLAAAFHQPIGWSHVAVGFSLGAIAVVFAVTLARRGFSLLAPLLFLTSYAIVGTLLDIGTRAIAKASTADAVALAIVELSIAAAVVGVAWLWTNRRSKPLI